MPQNAFFSTNSRYSGQQKTMQRHFFPTLHPLSTVIFATATVLAFVLLRDSRFNFHCYTQCEAVPTKKSARKCAATSRNFLCEITKYIHSSKPALLNHPKHFSMKLWSSHQPKNKVKTLLFHPPSPFPSDFCNCNCGGICTASQF